VDTKDLVPELEAQAAAPPGSDEFTFEQLDDLKAEMRAVTFEKLDEMQADMVADLDAKMDARFTKMEAMLERLLDPTPAPPPATPTATPLPQQRSIAFTKQRFDERATREAARAATSTPPPSRAASYSSAAAPRAPAGYRVPAPPPAAPPVVSYAYVPDRSAPVKNFTLLMVKCIQTDLVPADMQTQTRAIIAFMQAHDTRLKDLIAMDDSTFDELCHLGGAEGEWLAATDATIANEIQGSFMRGSTHV